MSTINIDLKLTKKQSETFKILLDKEHREVLYGGAKGSGKSYLGAVWVVYMCLTYPGIRALIGRTVLTQLRVTTIKTLLDLFKTCGIKDEHYTYNQQSNELKFYNGSEIVFRDLQYNPSDPNYDSLGGLELTIAFIDEVAQVSRQAYDVVRSLLRYKINEHNLKPTLFMSCNPSQSWLKQEFYIPSIQGTIEPHKIFIQALPTDNPYLPKEYLEILRSLPPKQMKRLYLGDWNYETESDSLFDFDEITSSVFKHTPKPEDKRYMSVDVARFGSDRSVVVIWSGLVVLEVFIYTKLSTTELSSQIQELIGKYGVHPSNIVVDSDGVGGGVADQIRGQNFVNNASPLHGQNYSNLKSQCYVKLAELFKENKMSLNVMDPNVIDDLTQELLSVRLKDTDKDNKVSVHSKEEMKKILGKSPDISDAIMMRMLFEVKNHKTTGKYSISFI
jgi:PBSX family phage terminase large subunit